MMSPPTSSACSDSPATSTHRRLWPIEPTTVTGYPSGHGFAQLTHGSQLVQETHDNQVFYPNDTEPGQSGSAVYTAHPDYGWAGFAVHTTGIHDDFWGHPHDEYNHGHRINEDAYNLIEEFK